MATQTVSTSNINELNTTTLNGLLKITDVLKETLFNTSAYVQQTYIDNKTTNNEITTYTTKTYAKLNDVVSFNKSLLESKQTDQIKVNYNDLLNKGKLTFTANKNVSYITYNLKNIIPNPLYNDMINNHYDNNLYATGKYDGITNTTYLKYNKTNIANKLSGDEYYIPSIGELGIIMENLQVINDSIDKLGEDYSGSKISYNAIIASSSLYSSQNINHDKYEYTIVDNVWCFDTSKAKITNKSLHDKYTLLPIYKYQNNVVINLDDELDDVVVNSILINNELFNYTEQSKPIQSFNIKTMSDFNVNNWLSNPFNAKYLFYILFPEVNSYICKDDNFAYLHNRYLYYYLFRRSINMPVGIIDNTSYFIDMSSISSNYQTNNGVTLPSYASWTNVSIDNDNINRPVHKLVTNKSEYWTQHLIYNIPVYGNHMVIMPIYGSGESNYNCKKYLTKSILYVTIPSGCTKFKCEMNNTTDCNIYTYKYTSIKGFDIYCIELSFKLHTPTDNVITFKCNYQNQTISKKYFYTIYSLQFSNNVTQVTYVGLHNYYVAKDPFYWWEIHNNNKEREHWKLSYFNDNSSSTYYNCAFGKLFDNSYYVTNSQMTYINYKYNSRFNNIRHMYFNISYDLSYTINNVGRNMQIRDHGTVTDRGLRVDRIIDSDVKTYSYIDKYNKTKNAYNYIDMNKSSISNYHTLSMDINGSYKPVIRVNRSVDNFGLYNDLIFIMPQYKYNNFAESSNYIDENYTYTIKYPVVGAKQTVCFVNKNVDDYSKMTNYLFLYNNTDKVIQLSISDPSLTLVSQKNAIIHLSPYELKLYYPSNFIHNNINTAITNSQIIYNIRITNKSNISKLYFKDHANLEYKNIYKLSYLYNNNYNSTYSFLTYIPQYIYQDIYNETNIKLSTNTIDLDIYDYIYNDIYNGHFLLISK